MKRITIILFALLIILAGIVAYEELNQPALTKTPAFGCTDVNNPCFSISMKDMPNLQINNWTRYKHSSCIDFTSLPDGEFHGYCGNYKIKFIQ